MRKAILIISSAICLAASAGAAVKYSWPAREAAAKDKLFSKTELGLSEIIQDIYLDGPNVWVATTDGLGRTDDYGATWRNYFEGELPTPADNVVAVAARDGDIWASCIEYVEEEGGDALWGRGLAHYDASEGRWYVYGKEPWKGGLPCNGRFELAWDVLVDDDGVVWVALWNGGLGKSTDNGKTWELIIPTGQPNEEGTHVYSVAKESDLIWAAAELRTSIPENILTGVFKSEDNGVTWAYYPLQHGVDGLCAIVDLQPAPGGDIAWVGTAHAYGPEAGPGHGVFKSEDGGRTWVNYDTRNGLSSSTAYAFASAGRWGWAGTFDGVDRTDDYGARWRNAGTAEGLPWYQLNALAAASETEVWAGTDKGLAYSSDSGATWRKIELSPRAGPADLPRAFAFPSPFAQRRDGRITFRYALASGGTVTLDVYDFAGRRVRRLVDGEYRGAGERLDEYWNGLRDDGKDAANGVYFFTLDVDGAAVARGKFVILN